MKQYNPPMPRVLHNGNGVHLYLRGQQAQTIACRPMSSTVHNCSANLPEVTCCECLQRAAAMVLLGADFGAGGAA